MRPLRRETEAAGHRHRRMWPTCEEISPAGFSPSSRCVDTSGSGLHGRPVPCRPRYLFRSQPQVGETRAALPGDPSATSRPTGPRVSKHYLNVLHVTRHTSQAERVGADRSHSSAKVDVGDASATARSIALAMRRSYSSFGHGAGSGTSHTGSLRASAGARSNSRRTTEATKSNTIRLWSAEQEVPNAGGRSLPGEREVPIPGGARHIRFRNKSGDLRYGLAVSAEVLPDSAEGVLD